MKRLKVTLRTVLLNGGTSAIAYFGWFQGIEWASNVALFLLWAVSLLVSCVGIVYLVVMSIDEEVARKNVLKKPAEPIAYRWVSRPLCVLQVSLCAASGHWVLAIFVTLGAFLLYAIQCVDAEYRKPVVKPEVA